ncbi:MAG: hypothetical protein P8168_03100 [Deltaproteobacteria bacterium]
MTPKSPVREARGPRTCRILLMAALPQEVRPFLRRLKARPRRDLGLPVWEGKWPGALVALSGMGAAPAQAAAKTLISRCRPQLLISLGFAGAFTPGLAAGDLILAEAFWHYDPDTGELVPGPQPPAPLPVSYLRQALQAAGRPAITGSLVTTPRIIPKTGRQEPLSGLPGVLLDLETNYLAEIAAAHSLTFLSLRAITDTASEEIPEFLRAAAEDNAAVGVRTALAWLREDFRRVNDLARFWWRSRRAARALSEALTIIRPLISPH